MNTPDGTIISTYTITPGWLAALRSIASLAARLAFVLAVIGGCTYLVFWRGETGWLYALAVFLLRYRSAF